MTQERQTARRVRMARIIARIAAATFVFGAGALACAWIWRVDLAQAALTRVLEDQGLGPVSFTIERVDFEQAVVSALRLRGGGLGAGRLEVGFHPLDLIDGRIDSVVLGGLVADLANGPDGLLVGGRPLLAPGGGGSGSADPGIEIGAFALDGARITYHDGDDLWRLEASSKASLIGGRAAIEGVSATLEGPPGKAVMAIGSLAVDLAGAEGVRVEIADLKLDLPGLPWALEGGALGLDMTGGGLRAVLNAAVLRNLEQPAVLIPVNLSGTAALVDGIADFELKGVGTTVSALALDIKGRYDGALAAQIALSPLRFAPGGLQPRDLLPMLGPAPEKVAGGLSLAGKLGYGAGKFTSDLALKLDALGFVTETATVEDLKGTIRITSPWPPATAAGQRLTAKVSSGGESARIDLTGQLTARPALKVERLAVDVAGGTLSTGGFSTALDRPAIKATIDVAHLDLAEVTRILGIDGLTGSGSLDGAIPVEVKGDSVTITDGRLKARGPGTLAYRPGNLPPQIAAAGREMELTLQALSNFHYDGLELEFAKAAAGEGYVLLRMAGGNPEALPGQPFNFNIRLESNFARLADVILLGLRSAQDLLGRAAGRLDK